jgi:hypothetical protein
MKYFLKKISLASLFVISVGFLLIGHAKRDVNPSRISASETNTIEAERATDTAPMNAEFRKKALPRGVWGGQHISFEVVAQGTTVEYDCAHATIAQKILLDARGRFSVPGTQVQERGGPVRQGAETGFPVRFAGQVKDKQMTLTVTNTATKELLGTFTLVHGSQPRLVKCK